jgi:hypothetical protein
MEVQGKIKLIGETKTFGSNGFQKREMVVTTEEQYPQHILLEFVQDKCALLDAFSVGQSVKVGINLRGREWTNDAGETKYFNSIQGWRIDAVEGQPQPDFANADLSNDGEEEPPF